MTRLLLVLLLTGCTSSPDVCANLVEARVTFDGASGYTAGSVHDGQVYFHPQAPVRDEPHFHFLVPCERLRRVP